MLPYEIYTLPQEEIIGRMGISSQKGINSGAWQEGLAKARTELEFINANHVKAISIFDDEYPARLKNCYDAPMMLYVLGNADLNADFMVGTVGTRKVTAAGADFCRKFTAELGSLLPGACIVSGLAYGVDAAAHQAALDKSMPTVAVVAHGLNTLYPAAHRDLARRIIKNGGAVVSEYPSGVKPYRKNFLERNRIIAGLTDALILVESEIKGGGMSTANYAFGYDREVFAVPGRPADIMSAGCNLLIRKQKANMLTCVGDFLETMGWNPVTEQKYGAPLKRSLFPELEGDCKEIYQLLVKAAAPVSADQIHALTSIKMPKLLVQLADMEFDGLIVRHPGNRYEAVQ